jgi:hypothetical protein
MAQKKSRQTFEKLKREQAVKERRLRKQERKAASRLAKIESGTDPIEINGGDDPHPPAPPIGGGG